MQLQRNETSQALSNMCDLLRVAIGSIVYLRNLLPETAFVDRELFSVRVRTLDPACNVDACRALLQCVEEGVLEALRRETLDSVDLLISSEREGPPLEQYRFSFWSDGDAVGVHVDKQDTGAQNNNHNNANGTVGRKKTRDLAKCVQVLLRKLLVTTDALAPLEEPCFLTLRLNYKSTVPEEYQTRWFRAGGTNMTLPDDGTALDLCLGSIRTGARRVDVNFSARPEQMAQDGSDSSQQGPSASKRPRT